MPLRYKDIEGINMTSTDFINHYWRYYKSLEEKFIKTLQYVEFSVDNFDTYSIEYTQLLQTIGSEIDVVFKTYCGFQPNDRKNISDYAIVVLQKYPDIVDQRARVQFLGEIIEPFANWNTTRPAQSLEWWQAYNEVKHNRVAQMKKASLKNVLYSLCALCLLEMKHYEEFDKAKGHDGIISDSSELFAFIGWMKTDIILATIETI